MRVVLNVIIITVICINVCHLERNKENNLPTNVTFLILIEDPREDIPIWIKDAFTLAEKSVEGEYTFEEVLVTVTRDDETESMSRLCNALAQGVSLILDLTWTGWFQAHRIADRANVPYYRADISLQPYVRVLDDYLMERSASDAALIFQDERELNQGLYYLVSTSILRVIVLDNLDKDSLKSLIDIRPSPSYYAIFATTANMEKLFKAAQDGNVAKRYDRWNLVFMDFKYSEFNYKNLQNISLLSMAPSTCCRLSKLDPSCVCPDGFMIQRAFLNQVIRTLVLSVEPFLDAGGELGITVLCDNISAAPKKNNAKFSLQEKMIDIAESENLMFYGDLFTLAYSDVWHINVVTESGYLDRIANWTSNEAISMVPNKELVSTKRFFRIGTAQAIPWAYRKVDPVTGAVMKDAEGKDMWEGYCIDLIAKLSEDMNFDYELVVPKDNSFGERRPDGTWGGLVGDLASGETDIVVASLTMTSEREEVIDFVAPYFEQSGILIVMRKPVRQTSLFKFMTVLKLEVWLSIVGALVFTGIMIWLLDKYSPYSARNNKQAYPYPCRDFTLKESFWFALTSFTPQGGGEAPKALSARTLVAAYWLFVVLMLATFTANLAAFLTVERMQAPVQSLEQLARQSRINYTVVENSDTHRYFINMKFAEDTLYRVWKEITLNSTSDQTQYRVWDYPIKEQYGHILLAINSSQPVQDAIEGFRKVNEHEEADFAFIHDSAEIKYEVTRNCNLTEVGEIFAEQPYAVAVQQGSHLQDEISRRILDLQKDRYFEQLSSKYWNQSAKGECPNTDDSEGITLESLGGVFIATIFGLALAMITLAGEIFYHKRKKGGTVQQVKPVGVQFAQNISAHADGGDYEPPLKERPLRRVTIGTSFRPVAEKNPSRVSYISVFPRQQLHP